MKAKELLVANGIKDIISDSNLNIIQSLIDSGKLSDGDVLLLKKGENCVNVIQSEKIVFIIDNLNDSLSKLLKSHNKIYLMIIEEVYYFSVILCV